VKDFNTIDFRTKDFNTIIKIRIPFHYFDPIPRRAAFYTCLQNAHCAVHYLVAVRGIKPGTLGLSTRISYAGGTFVRCFKGESVFHRGITDDFVKRQEIYSFRHIAKLTVKGEGGIMRR
jgi:hypothetical protein